MRMFEESDVRAIHRACHPAEAPQAMRWYEAHPTLVLEVDRELVGYTSYSLSVQPHLAANGETMVGYGIDIHPAHQGKGYGRILCDERMAVARAVGAVLFVGHAAPDNKAMIRLFEQDGLEPYFQSGDVMLYKGPVK